MGFLPFTLWNNHVSYRTCHINAQNIGKIYGSGHSTLIRTDDHEMIIVNLEIVNVLYQRFQELIGWEKVVKTI